jgi:hypothetical protein
MVIDDVHWTTVHIKCTKHSKHITSNVPAITTVPSKAPDSPIPFYDLTIVIGQHLHKLVQKFGDGARDDGAVVFIV